MAAGGLYARFDCGMPRDPKMSQAGALARLIYMEAVMYSKENMTDGLIERVALAHFTVDVDQKTKMKELNRLAKLGALEKVELGWRIPEEVWRRWNPLKVEVDAKRAAAAEKKAQYRAAKKAGTTESVHDVSPSDTLGTRQVVQGLSSTPEPEPKTEPKTEPVPVPVPEPEPEIPSTSSKLTLVATPPDEEEESTYDDALKILVRYRYTHRGTDQPPIVNLLAWEATTKANENATHGNEIRQLLTQGTDAASAVAGIIDPAEARRIARDLGLRVEFDERPLPDPDCGDCAGSGWRTIEEGSTRVEPCPCMASNVTPLRRTS